MRFTETDGGAGNAPVVKKNIFATDGGPVVVVEQMCHSLPMAPFEQTSVGNVPTHSDTPRRRPHGGRQQNNERRVSHAREQSAVVSKSGQIPVDHSGPVANAAHTSTTAGLKLAAHVGQGEGSNSPPRPFAKSGAGAQRPKTHSRPVERPEGLWRMLPTGRIVQEVYTRAGARRKAYLRRHRALCGRRQEGKCSLSE